MRKRRETIRYKGVQDRISDGGERATKMKGKQGEEEGKQGRMLHTKEVKQKREKREVVGEEATYKRGKIEIGENENRR